MTQYLQLGTLTWLLTQKHCLFNNGGYKRLIYILNYNIVFFSATDSWSIVASLSSKRDAVAACLFGDRLIAVGGYDGSHYLQTVEQYDPISNEWLTLAPLLTGRAGACIIAISNNRAQPDN